METPETLKRDLERRRLSLIKDGWAARKARNDQLPGAAETALVRIGFAWTDLTERMLPVYHSRRRDHQATADHHQIGAEIYLFRLIDNFTDLARATSGDIQP